MTLSLFAEMKAKSEGFRAFGNEPGWVLTIVSDKSVYFFTNAGEDKTEFVIIEKFSSYGSTEYKMHSKNNLLYLRVEKRRCKDTVVDIVYESTVYINFDGVNMKGCGKALY